jgi:hypothetical protein
MSKSFFVRSICVIVFFLCVMLMKPTVIQSQVLFQCPQPCITYSCQNTTCNMLVKKKNYSWRAWSAACGLEVVEYDDADNDTTNCTTCDMRVYCEEYHDIHCYVCK